MGYLIVKSRKVFSVYWERSQRVILSYFKTIVKCIWGVWFKFNLTKSPALEGLIWNCAIFWLTIANCAKIVLAQKLFTPS